METERSGHKTLKYNRKAIYFPRAGEKSRWELYRKRKGKNPMEEEFKKAEKKYSWSKTKLIKDTAKQSLPQEVSRDVRRNVEQ